MTQSFVLAKLTHRSFNGFLGSGRLQQISQAISREILPAFGEEREDVFA